MRVAIVGPVYPFRAGIAYCTTRLAEELHGDVISFRRQYPKRLYPGGDDIDPTLPRANAAFILDILNPLTWLRARRQLREYDVVIFVWWIWVWAIPYRVMMWRLRRVILQCHNIGEKEPAWWKRALTNLVLRRANILVVHANSEAEEAWKRTKRDVVKAFLPVHAIGVRTGFSRSPDRPAEAGPYTALFFGHIRPFKGLDVALEAWKRIKTNVTLVVAGEPWFGFTPQPQRNVRFDLRFIPDAEVADFFNAADVVIAPYRAEAQSGVAMTAFHFEKPVIASRVGGLPDIINDRNGILVPPENPQALADAVDEFFTARDRAAMERAASASAQHYSWAEYANIFRRLLIR